MATDNNVISAITLMERLDPLLHRADRAPISLHHLEQIEDKLQHALRVMNGIVTQPLIITPIAEVLTLIKTIKEEKNFVETNSETKEIICDKLDTSLTNLYLFAGRYYETHEFDYTFGKHATLQRIVDACVQSGYYFNYGG